MYVYYKIYKKLHHKLKFIIFYLDIKIKFNIRAYLIVIINLKEVFLFIKRDNTIKKIIKIKKSIKIKIDIKNA